MIKATTLDIRDTSHIATNTVLNTTIIEDYFSIEHIEYDLSAVNIIEDYYTIEYERKRQTQSASNDQGCGPMRVLSELPFVENEFSDLQTTSMPRNSAVLAILSKSKVDNSQNALATSSQAVADKDISEKQPPKTSVVTKSYSDRPTTLSKPTPMPSSKKAQQPTRSTTKTTFGSPYHARKVHSSYDTSAKPKHRSQHVTEFTLDKALAAKPVVFNKIRESVTYYYTTHDDTPPNTPKLKKQSACGLMLSVSI